MVNAREARKKKKLPKPSILVKRLIAAKPDMKIVGGGNHRSRLI